MLPAAVRVDDLVVRYGSTTAVAGLSFSAPAGQVTAIVGPNGAGKTSTVEVCVGLRAATAGRVEILGTEVPVPAARRSALHTRVGVMLQDGGLYSTARPLALVRYIGSLYPRPRDPAALLERLGIDPCVRTPIRRLSGGEQRRVAAAAALVGRPDLVFLDEPTAGLDAVARRGFHDLVAELVREGAAVVLTTHLMDDVERLADHVVVLVGGRAVRQGTVDDLVGTEDVMTFRGPAHADLSGLRAALPPRVIVDEGPPGHYRTSGVLDPGVLSAVAAWCEQHGIRASQMRLGRRSLEDVVVDLVGDL